LVIVFSSPSSSSTAEGYRGRANDRNSVRTPPLKPPVTGLAGGIPGPATVKTKKID